MSDIKCPICNTKLQKAESMIAGIGPVCVKKVTFAEALDSENLASMMGQRENLSDKTINRTVICESKDNIFLSTIVSLKDEAVTLIERKKYKDLLDETNSPAKAFLNSIKRMPKKEIDSVSSIISPVSPDLKRLYRKFSTKYNKLLNQYEEDKHEFNERGLNNHFYKKIFSKKDMTNAQIKSRDLLKTEQTENPKVYNFFYSNALYHRSTLIYRLQNIENKESKLFLKFLQKNIEEKFKNFSIKDYGLTDSEIENALRHSNQKVEAILFNSYLNGNRNFRNMLKIAENMSSLDLKRKLKAFKLLMILASNKKKISKDDLKKEFN